MIEIAIGLLGQVLPYLLIAGGALFGWWKITSNAKERGRQEAERKALEEQARRTANANAARGAVSSHDVDRLLKPPADR